MDRPLFSIIVVTLNPGDKLFSTIESIRIQTCRDYRVVVKDGGSTDGSVDRLKAQKAAQTGPFAEFWSRVEIYTDPDKSIYEGMNQATGYATGQYLYFLNCGDHFYDESVLEGLQEEILNGDHKAPVILYGDIYDALRGVRVASNPRIDGFGCYRNVPCHQACIYDASLFAERGYETKYRVRGDYEHFLWCFYVKNAHTVYVPRIIASYEGGGYSETKGNRRRSVEEHKEITAQYMSRAERFRYRSILVLTLAPLRTRMANSPALSGLYNRMKDVLYRLRGFMSKR